LRVGKLAQAGGGTHRAFDGSRPRGIGASARLILRLAISTGSLAAGALRARKVPPTLLVRSDRIRPLVMAFISVAMGSR
jgi:hypothetical protein